MATLQWRFSIATLQWKIFAGDFAAEILDGYFAVEILDCQFAVEDFRRRLFNGDCFECTHFSVKGQVWAATVGDDRRKAIGS